MMVADRLGQRYGRLVVIAQVGKSVDGHVTWRCRCDCGADVVRARFGASVIESCGCYISERMAQRNYRHGERYSREYGIWQGIRGRCLRPTEPGYAKYGALGITICDRWRDSFEDFLADMGRCPTTSHSIDRKDNDGPYSPENCRWATKREQTLNRRVTIWVTFNNQTKALTEWAESLSKNYYTLWSRLREYHWTVERAFTT